MQVLAEGRERCLRSLLARLRKLFGLVVVCRGPGRGVLADWKARARWFDVNDNDSCSNAWRRIGQADWGVDSCVKKNRDRECLTESLEDG